MSPEAFPPRFIIHEHILNWQTYVLVQDTFYFLTVITTQQENENKIMKMICAYVANLTGWQTGCGFLYFTLNDPYNSGLAIININYEDFCKISYLDLMIQCLDNIIE